MCLSQIPNIYRCLCIPNQVSLCLIEQIVAVVLELCACWIVTWNVFKHSIIHTGRKECISNCHVLRICAFMKLSLQPFLLLAWFKFPFCCCSVIVNLCFFKKMGISARVVVMGVWQWNSEKLFPPWMHKGNAIFQAIFSKCLFKKDNF